MAADRGVLVALMAKDTLSVGSDGAAALGFKAAISINWIKVAKDLLYILFLDGGETSKRVNLGV